MCACAFKNNLAVVLHGKDDLLLEEWPMPKPKNNEALIQIECVGICGSDVSFWVHGKIGPYVVEKPMVIGHEASGTVIEIGDDVKNIRPGDRVAIEPGVPCRTCVYCKSGFYNQCESVVFCACPPHHGNLTKYYTQAADFLYKLPKNVTLEEGALIEPLSVAVHACKIGQVTANSSVLILGSGPIGLVTILTAKAFGATKIVSTDLLDYRLKMAKEFGANATLKINPNDSEDITINKVLGLFDEPPEITIECTGVENCVRIGYLVTKKCGTLVLVGMGKPEMCLPIFSAQCKEINVKGCFRYCNDYPTALGLVSSGKINILPLITHHYEFKDSIKAFKSARAREGNAVKVMIHVNKN